MTPGSGPAAVPGSPARSGPLLLVEDTRSLQMVYASVLRGAGHEVLTASTAAEGESLFRSRAPAVVLLDLVLPDRDGLALMRGMLAQRREALVIAITADGSADLAVAAMRAGAHDYLVKPFDESRLLRAVGDAYAAPGPRPPAAARDAPGADGDLGLLGASQAMAAVRSMLRSAARSAAPVFLTGESGTGKDVAAKAIHALSPRAGTPFVPLNGGAAAPLRFDAEILEALGAPPGKGPAPGDRGTLFLDEVCEMAPALQARLLRFLQTGTIQPAGPAPPRRIDLRLVCATSRDPIAAVRRGEFREDLFYRLHVVPIHLPPLRDRDDDPVEIAEAALHRFAAEEGRQFDGLSPEVRALLRTLPWPGNVRQLLNVIRNVAVLHDGGRVTPAMLPPMMVGLPDGPRPAPVPQGPLDGLVGQTLAAIERQAIEATLARHNGSVPRAARTLDVSPSTLYRKIEGWSRG